MTERGLTIRCSRLARRSTVDVALFAHVTISHPTRSTSGRATELFPFERRGEGSMTANEALELRSQRFCLRRLHPEDATAIVG